MARFNFTSIGAAMNAGLQEELARQEMERVKKIQLQQQAEQFQLQKNADLRAGESQKAALELQKVALEDKQRGEAAADVEAAGVGGLLAGNAATRAKTLTPSMVNVIPGGTTLPSKTVDMTTGVGDETAPVMKGQTFGPVVTPEEVRSKGNQRQQLFAKLKQTPGLTPDQHTVIDLIEASGDKNVSEEGLAKVLGITSASDTQDVFRVDYLKKKIQRYSNGEWIDHTGPIPKNAHWLNESDPALHAGREINIKVQGQSLTDTPSNVSPDVKKIIEDATSNIRSPRIKGQHVQELSIYADDPETLGRKAQRIVLDNEDPATARAVEGRRDAINALGVAKKQIEALKAAGVDTGLLKGSAENLVRKLGSSTDTRLVALGSQISQTLNEYRRAMTGVQFSQKEGETYKKLFPDYTNDFDVNEAALNQVTSFMGDQQRTFWESKFGPKGSKMIGATQDATPVATTKSPTEGMTPAQKLEYYKNLGKK